MTELPQGIIRQHLEDFLVEEIPAYEPRGTGGHAFITFRKRGLTTGQAVERIAAQLGTSSRDAGVAGQKDKHAVTIQTASFPLAPTRDLAEAAAAIDIPDVQVLGAVRHDHKLRTGHLKGNRFTITVRGLGKRSLDQIAERLRAVAELGVPNAFGPQRFGRHGTNPDRALEWITGRARPPRSHAQRKLLLSAWQSSLFNQVLDRRVTDGTWTTVLAGDIAKKRDTGGLFLVPADPAGLDDARSRAAQGALSATGPMFGRKMRWPAGQPGELEREILVAALGDPARLDALGRSGKGTRRALRLWVTDPVWEASPNHDYLTVSFVLPKGAYATTVLGRVCDLVDAQHKSGH